MEFVNVFSGGLNQDLDVQIRPNNTYENSICGRIIFNAAGNMAYENAQGNKYYFSLPAGYIPIGGNEFPDCLCIYSTNNNNSEIGLLRIDTNEVPTYTTVFNDAFDFNGEKLGFRADKLIKKAWGVIESIAKQRTYFTEFYNEPYTFNIVAGLQVNNADFINGDYQPLANGKYPWWYSVHSMKYYADWLPGRIKYVRKGNAEDSPGEAAGSLKSGVFQYTYRLWTREGYATTWRTLTRHIFLTTVDIDTIGNAHDYFMDASNIMTPYSIWLEIKDVDSRFWKMEVAYVYSIAKDATLESFIFDSILLDGTTTDYNVQHVAHGGTPVDLQQYNAYPVAIIKALTLQEKNQRLFWGNIETIGDLSIDTSLISIVPNVKALFDPDSDPRLRVDIPLTNVNIVAGFTNTSLVSYLDTSLNPVTEVYKIVHDFLTYQGMQVEHLYPGYWRGETYPFGILLYDRKGIPFFVQNIQDFTFPNQFDPDDNSPAGYPYKLTDDTAFTKIQVLGATFNGITIPYSVLYDDMGRQRVSGFSIVRCIRKPRILFQGILLDTVYDTAEDSGKATRPLPAHVEEPFSVPHGTDSFEYDTNYIPSAGSGAYANRPYTFSLHSPELSFGFPVYGQTGQAGLQETDYLEFLGVVRSTYELGDLAKTLELNKTAKHNSFYTKHYTTIIDGIPLYNVGDRSRMQNTIEPGFNDDPTTGNIKIIGYDFDNIGFYFQNGDDTWFTAVLPGGNLHHALGAINYWVVKAKDFKLLDSGYDGSAERSTRYSIVNYNAPSSNYYNAATDKRIYISTGHFQPITPAVIANVQKHFNADSPGVPDGLIFDNVEVFGGDCFVNLFDFVRLYPKYSYGAGDYDYAFGVIVPLESNLNHSLRKGRSLAKDGIEPNFTADGTSTDFTNGASSNQPEEFNINDVLLHQENVQFFPSLPEDRQVINNQFRNRWVYTELKFYGEIQDNYRKILANNFQDVIGIYGDITGSLLWKDQVYSFQPKGWGRLRIQDRTLIPAENPQAVVTGAGGILDGIDYFSHFYGTQHTLSLYANEYAMYWVDVNNRAIMKYNSEGQQPLSDTKGLHDWAQFVLQFYDNQQISFDGTSYVNIQTVYDITMNEILFVFGNNVQTFPAPPAPLLYPISGTLVYNENMDAFTNFYPNFSLWNVKYRNIFFSNSLDDRVRIYRHNYGNYGEFYETVYDTVLTFTVNPSADDTKKFDNILCNINKIGATLLKSVKFETEDQVLNIPDFQSFVDPLSGKKKWTYRFNDLIFPIFDVVQKIRAQGKTCRVTLTFANSGMNKLKISSNKTKWRPAQNVSVPPVPVNTKIIP